MINWTYQGKDILSHADLYEDCTDIVYELKFSDETKYIGKKVVRSESILPAQKTGVRKGAERIYKNVLRDINNKIVTAKNERKKARSMGFKAKREEYDHLLTNKPFIKYEGSSTENDGKTLVSKEILYQSSNKKTATYIEAALLFENNVLFTKEYNNKNILGSFYENSLDGLLGEEKDD